MRIEIIIDSKKRQRIYHFCPFDLMAIIHFPTDTLSRIWMAIEDTFDQTRAMLANQPPPSPPQFVGPRGGIFWSESYQERDERLQLAKQFDQRHGAYLRRQRPTP